MQIEIKNVSYCYDKKSNIKALDDVSFNIEKGEFVAIIGQTGAGKSTLVQMFNGLIIPSEGTINIYDYSITNKTKPSSLSLLRKNIGLVFQFPEYQLFEDTILKDVMFGPINFGMTEKAAEESAKKALKSVYIDESLFNKSPFEISGGQKRRVSIAGILASEPEVLVFDEPTVGLDPHGKKEIMDLLKKINKEGKTIILVTHDMEVVNDYANRVIVLKEGKLIKDCKPIELFNDSNLNKLCLDYPSLYLFKNLLKKYKYKKDISKINSLKELVNSILSGEKHD